MSVRSSIQPAGHESRPTSVRTPVRTKGPNSDGDGTFRPSVRPDCGLDLDGEGLDLDGTPVFTLEVWTWSSRRRPRLPSGLKVWTSHWRSGLGRESRTATGAPVAVRDSRPDSRRKGPDVWTDGRETFRQGDPSVRF